ncbi:MAG: 8-amino-7-oxononanoate synthase [Thermodesulfobacteriota bacterium]
MDRLSWLARRRAAGELRHLSPLERRADGQVLEPDSLRPIVDFSSNDYLGLASHPEVIAASGAALERFGAGAGAARLMSGDMLLHHELETEVAAYKGKEAALLLASGFQANVTIIPALMGRHDVIFADRLNHASLVDGSRLAQSRLHRFRHNDMDHLEDLLRKHRGSGEALIVVESLYSMDGDMAPLAELVALKERYNCLLMVDEAHATGLFGPDGSGLVAQSGCPAGVDLIMGTFGKALGSFGAYIAADGTMIDFLINRARGFIYSTALPPAVIGASLAAIRLCKEQPRLRQELWEKVAIFRAALAHHGCPTSSPSQIIPLTMGKSKAALALAHHLREQGVYATAVRPPTVPENTARLRFSVTRTLTPAQLEETAALVGGWRKKE